MKETSLVLRVCRPNYTSLDGFTWPAEIGAEVSAPDWEKTNECGNGLHGWLYGQGDHSGVPYWQEADAKWLVLEVPSAEIIKLDGKCKFPRAVVRFIGTKPDAADYIAANEPRAANVAIIGACKTVGDKETVLVGPLGTATAGYRGTATAGESATATAGNYGTATAGNYATATAGNYGTATAGYRGTATAGYCGTATAGNYGTATVGDRGTATAGYQGEIRIRWWDTKASRNRTAIAYVGEDGIKADTKYRLNDRHQFEEVAE